MSEVDVVRLVFAGHQHQCQSVDELHAIQGVDTHVHQDTVQHRHWNILQQKQRRKVTKLHKFMVRCTALIKAGFKTHSTLRIGASLTDKPVRRKTMVPVTRCSLTPRN